MNNLEAKLILRSYRPGGEDASDPLFRQALEQVERDPELKRWFAQEMALETQMQSKLQAAVSIPQNLRANLLALRKTRRSSPWWLMPLKLAGAASAAALIALAIFHFVGQQAASIESFQKAMALCSLQHKDHVSFDARDIGKIDQWLQAHNIATNFDLPQALLELGAQGCKVVDWNRQKVAMICFVGRSGTHMDLFVMDNAAAVISPDPGRRYYTTARGLAIACWSKGDKFYMLAGNKMDELKATLPEI